MKLKIGEIKNQVDQMNSNLSQKSTKMEELLNAIEELINDDELEGKAFEAAKNYFEQLHIPIIRGFILAYDEIKKANTNYLQDLYNQVEADDSYFIDTSAIEIAIAQKQAAISELEEKAKILSETMPSMATSTQNFINQQNTAVAALQAERQKVIDFDLVHGSHYNLANQYLENVSTGISCIQGRHFDKNYLIRKIDTKNLNWAKALNNGWELKKQKAQAANAYAPASDVTYISVDISKYSKDVQESIKSCLEGIEKYKDDEVMLEYYLSALDNVLDYANGYGQNVEFVKEKLRGVTSGTLQIVGGVTEVEAGGVIFLGTTWSGVGIPIGIAGGYMAVDGVSNVTGGLSTIGNAVWGDNEGDTANFMKNAYKKISASCGQDEKVGENIYNLTQLGIGIYSVGKGLKELPSNSVKVFPRAKNIARAEAEGLTASTVIMDVGNKVVVTSKTESGMILQKTIIDKSKITSGTLLIGADVYGTNSAKDSLEE